MAQSWLVLAQQAEKSPAPHPGYDTAPIIETSRPAVTETSRPAVAQQQQQIQPKKKEE
jgi:hypothetical protein